MKIIIKKFLFRFLDILITPILFIPLLILKFCRKKGLKRFPFTMKALDWIGVYPLYEHYYEPLIVPQKTIDRRRLNLKRELKIDYQIDKQLSLLQSFNFKNELLTLESQVIENVPKYRYDNRSFESGDSEFYYSLIRKINPGTIIEVGSGNSTIVALNALKLNSVEYGSNSSLICIEPYEGEWLNKVEGIELLREKVENINIDFFKQLKENDIFFVDSSHMIRPQGDVIYEILNIIPHLNKGVYIHIHDIFTPYDYCYDWLVNQRHFWNEQYLLEAYLSENDKVEVIGSLNYLSHDYPELLSAALPKYSFRKGCDLGSFWLRKR